MQLIEGGSGPEPLSKKVVDELKLKHGGELVSAEVSDGTYVFRRPTKGEWRRYTAVLFNDRRINERSSATEQLCVDTFVYPTTSDGEPDVARLRTLFEKLPGLPLSIVNDLGDLAGAGESVKVGKL